MARRLEAALAGIGVRRAHAGAYLAEFAVHVPDARRVHALLLERGVLAGFELARWFPDDPVLADALLLACTELTSEEDIARLVAALGELGVGTAAPAPAATVPR
jgi:glycine cleavage system pyridoxal-binding protein P